MYSIIGSLVLILTLIYFFFVRIQVIRERVMCSKRAVVATGFIIGLILLAAGVSAGIVFTVIKTDNSSSSDSSNLNLGISL